MQDRGRKKISGTVPHLLGQLATMRSCTLITPWYNYCWSQYKYYLTYSSIKPRADFTVVLLLFISVEKEVVMHKNQVYETVTRMNHSRSVTTVSTEPCPAYGVVGASH